MSDIPFAVPADVQSAIRQAQQIALIGHVNPDADCITSIAGLWLALPELGVTPHAVLPAGTVSRRMQFLLELAGIRPVDVDEAQQCDLALVLDTAKARRVNVTGKLEALPAAAVANIDHHTSNEMFGRWNWVVGSASSTAELVYHVLRALGCQITPTIATLLYAGIHSDTQGFSLSNTTAESLAAAHDLAAAGARIPDVCEQMHRSQSPQEFALLKTVYANTQVSADGRLAWSVISFDELQHSGCDASAIDDQVEIPRSIEGISVAILFSEGEAGVVRMNFRGERGISVLELAQRLGGGGHRASAGARLSGSLPEIVERVLAEAQIYLSAAPDPAAPAAME